MNARSQDSDKADLAQTALACCCRAAHMHMHMLLQFRLYYLKPGCVSAKLLIINTEIVSFKRLGALWPGSDMRLEIRCSNNIYCSAMVAAYTHCIRVQFSN